METTGLDRLEGVTMNLWIDCIVTMVLFSINFILLIMVFGGRSKQTGRQAVLIMAGGICAAFAIVVIINKTQIVRVFDLCYIVSYCTLTIILCLALFRCSVREALFGYFLIQGLMDDSFIISKMLQFYLLQPVMGELPSFAASYILALGAAFPAIILFIRRGLRPLVDTTQGMTFWRYLWLVPVSYYLVYRIGISPQYISVRTVWVNAEVIVPIFWIVATCLSYLLIVNMLLGTVKNMEDQKKLEITNQLLQLQNAQYDRLCGSIEETRRMRHDIRHMMLIISGYAEKGEIDRLKKFVAQSLKDMELEEGFPLCENPAVDSIVNHYLQIAKKEKIKMEIKLELLKELPCSEAGICVILSNLLENAIEACTGAENETLIELKINAVNENMMVILVKNSITRPVRMKNNEFLSAKRNYEEPGFGISSVKRIADKYGGRAVFESTDKEFCAKVFLQKPTVQINVS